MALLLGYRRPMGLLLHAVDRVLCAAIATTIRVVKLLIDLILWLDKLRGLLPRKLRRWTGSLRRLARRIFVQPPPVPPSTFRRRRRPWNRTPEHIEEVDGPQSAPRGHAALTKIIAVTVFGQSSTSRQATFERGRLLKSQIFFALRDPSYALPSRQIA